MIKTVNDIGFEIKSEDNNYDYQKKLTPKLDIISTNFNQNIINEIVLWKVNRYAELSENTLSLLNTISTSSIEIDEDLTRKVLKSLIKEQGVQLAMASTILRFRNPHIYQIIDQRVYRILYGLTLKLPLYVSEKNTTNQIEIYLNYLSELRVVSKRLNIRFEDADRILYEADKRCNKDEKLINYGTVVSI